MGEELEVRCDQRRPGGGSDPIRRSPEGVKPPPPPESRLARREALWNRSGSVSWPEFLEVYGPQPDWEIDAPAAEAYHLAVIRWFEHNERVNRPRTLFGRALRWVRG